MPVRSIAPSLSLRSKLLLSFGGVVLLACGMALLWGFVQYKNLANDVRRPPVATSASRGCAPSCRPSIAAPRHAADAEPRCATRCAGSRPPRPRRRSCTTSITTDELLALGGGPMGAPKLPWYVRAQIERGAPT